MRPTEFIKKIGKWTLSPLHASIARVCTKILSREQYLENIASLLASGNKVCSKYVHVSKSHKVVYILYS